jgi:hypothetical protein
VRGLSIANNAHLASMRLLRLLISLSLTFSLASCVNPYTKYYRSYTSGITASSTEGYQPCDGPIQIIATSNIQNDVNELRRQGYVAIGSSYFNGPANQVSETKALRQARNVGACKVLMTSSYTNTNSESAPLNVPNNGIQTMMMPYSVQRYDSTAIYLVKKSFIFGAIVGAVPPDLSKQIGYSGGLLVTTIVRGSAAYRADIFEGDVILSMNGNRLNEENPYQTLLLLFKQKAGHTISMSIWRNGEVLEKSVMLGRN